MPSTFTSPYAASFRNACNKGVSYNAAVENIAKRYNTTTNQVWSSLYKAGCCNRQKFNGQWIYFPNSYKATSRNAKSSQYAAWQWYCEWCLSSGNCTPTTFGKTYSSQSAFAKAFAKYWSKQFTTNGTSKTSKSSKTSTTKTAKRTGTKTAKSTKGRTNGKSSTSRTGTKTGNYRFSNYNGSKRKAA